MCCYDLWQSMLWKYRLIDFLPLPSRLIYSLLYHYMSSFSSFYVSHLLLQLRGRYSKVRGTESTDLSLMGPAAFLLLCSIAGRGYPHSHISSALAFDSCAVFLSSTMRNAHALSIFCFLRAGASVCVISLGSPGDLKKTSKYALSRSMFVFLLNHLILDHFGYFGLLFQTNLSSPKRFLQREKNTNKSKSFMKKWFATLVLFIFCKNSMKEAINSCRKNGPDLP